MDDKKDDRRSSVPLGTFRPSSIPEGMPPVPKTAAQTSHKPAIREDDTVQTRPVRISRSMPPPPPPTSDSDAERKRVRTLVGVPTPPGGMRTAPPGTYPAPPKWKEPSERDDEPTQRGPAVAVPVARIELKPTSARPPTPPAAADENISDTIQQMLDEQTSVTMEVDDDTAVDLAMQAAAVPMTSMNDDGPPPSAARRSSNPPVMLPAHIAEAHARESQQVLEQIAQRNSSVPPANLFALPLVPADSSSLAPAEVGAPVRDDAAPALGFMVVAAMAVVGIGGWLVTSGGYQRPQAPVAAASMAKPPTPPSAAAALKPVPVPPPQVAAPQAPAVVEAPAPVAAPVVAAPAAAVAKAPALPAAPKAAPVAPPAKLKPFNPPPLASARVVRAAPAAPSPVVRITKVEDSSVEPAAPVVAVTPTPAPETTAEPEELPDTPSRDDVLARIEGLRAKVNECAEGKKGTAELDVTIAGSGVITTVLVGGDFAGTPQGSCIARSVRQARFPKFKKDRFRLLYPFSL
ncbi:MAG TPA: hypothetical protein VHM19_02920 [Polyangiales bacterium]|nr:hypothetical protein [Polyangiales bacterium]